MAMSNWNKKRSVMRHYNQSAKVYDSQYCEEQEAKIRRAMNNLTLHEDSIILDAGCGTGLLFAHIVEKAKFIVGLDISRGTLKEAEKKAKNYKNVALILSDADNMPFFNKSFDAVFALTLLQNMPSPKETLNEIKRVSKSSAAIVVTGLRKAFTEGEFSEMLEQANLKVAVLKLDEPMREHVSICFKIRR